MENVDCELAVALVLARYVFFDYVACFSCLRAMYCRKYVLNLIIIIEL